MLIVVVFAGPEIFVAMELTLMLEVMGASTFCMFFLSAIKAFFEPYLKNLKPYFERFAQFEGHSFCHTDKNCLALAPVSSIELLCLNSSHQSCYF